MHLYNHIWIFNTHKENRFIRQILTNSYDFFYLNAGCVDFFGKFSNCLVGILICKGIHISSNT